MRWENEWQRKRDYFGRIPVQVKIWNRWTDRTWRAESLESRKSPFWDATYVNRVKRGVIPERMYKKPYASENQGRQVGTDGHSTVEWDSSPQASAPSDVRHDHLTVRSDRGCHRGDWDEPTCLESESMRVRREWNNRYASQGYDLNMAYRKVVLQEHLTALESEAGMPEHVTTNTATDLTILVREKLFDL